MRSSLAGRGGFYAHSKVVVVSHILNGSRPCNSLIFINNLIHTHVLQKYQPLGPFCSCQHCVYIQYFDKMVMDNQLMDDIPIPLPANPTRLMDRLRAFMRARHMAYRTEKTYCTWILDFIRYHKRKHPEQMGADEVNAWLSHLANNRHVAINTQKTALNAVVFLFKQFLGRELNNIAFANANKGRRLPVVFSHDEALRVLAQMSGTHKVAASLMYGSGLRVMEAVRLRVQDVDFANDCLFIRESKGDRWRRTLLPRSLIEPLRAQIAMALALHQQDVTEGYGEVYMPNALAKKYPTESGKRKARQDSRD